MRKFSFADKEISQKIKQPQVLWEGLQVHVGASQVKRPALEVGLRFS
jgi:hypothetical protein